MSKVLREVVVEGVETIGAHLHRSNAVLILLRPSSMIATASLREQKMPALQLAPQTCQTLARFDPIQYQGLPRAAKKRSRPRLARKRPGARAENEGQCRDPRPFTWLVRKPSFGFETTKRVMSSCRGATWKSNCRKRIEKDFPTDCIHLASTPVSNLYA